MSSSDDIIIPTTADNDEAEAPMSEHAMSSMLPDDDADPQSEQEQEQPHGSASSSSSPLTSARSSNALKSIQIMTQNANTHHLVKTVGVDKASRMRSMVPAIINSINAVGGHPNDSTNSQLDVLCLQELYTPHGFLYLKSAFLEGKESADLVQIVTKQAAAAGLPYVAMPTHEHDTSMGVMGMFSYYTAAQCSGLVMYSRFPLKDVRWKLWRSNLDVGTAKGFLKATVMAPDATHGGEFDVYTLHLDAHSKDRRAEQLSTLNDFVRASSSVQTHRRPIVICGDFNLTRSELKQWLPQLAWCVSDVFGADVDRHPGTFKKGYCYPFDHILVSTSSSDGGAFSVLRHIVVDVREGGGEISDHKGVYAEIQRHD
eukprot:PhM_4_TR13590/c0_g1_i1/m.63716